MIIYSTMEQKQYKRTTITAALPYANGGVHIGHLAGVYVPADIYARYMRLKNEDVVFIGGSDEHGVPITIRARKEGVSPQDVVDRFHAMRKKSFEDFGISFDVYSRTTSPTHHQLASDFFKKLYEDGKLLHKKNTFTDFIDVTRWLVAEKYAAKDRVAAFGGSAGGLLMGAVANMAPEDYRVILSQVPFVDVVTTMLDPSIPLTTNEYDEWGNPETSAESYAYMLSYSPYDNLKAQAYPAMFVGTGLWDSQVQYWEPAKYVARLRDVNTGKYLIVFRTNMEAGHGGKSGRFRRFRESAEMYAFMLDQLQVK